ncbi:MAG TPA: hypothetical protein ENN21_05185 [Spirochaetes bacterium]|nr:hypothetical protein [Spirochaetota bacterium]
MKTELLKNRLVIIIEDDVVLNSVSLYDAVVDALTRAPTKRIAIDLSRLEHLDDLNITMLMRIIDRFSPRGTHFPSSTRGKLF